MPKAACIAADCDGKRELLCKPLGEISDISEDKSNFLVVLLEGDIQI